MSSYPAASERAGPTAVILAHQPAAYRLAVGLCGRADVAAAVAARVLDRAAVLAPRWPTAAAAERWFFRFTVLSARAARRPGPAGDAAGLSWLAGLPSQQREAVVLHHGLGLDLHRMAAAMDCSSTAAANHLGAATAVLTATGAIPTWTERLPGTLAAIVPPPAALAADVARAVGRRRRRVLVRAGGAGPVDRRGVGGGLGGVAAVADGRVLTADRKATGAI